MAAGAASQFRRALRSCRFGAGCADLIEIVVAQFVIVLQLVTHRLVMLQFGVIVEDVRPPDHLVQNRYCFGPRKSKPKSVTTSSNSGIPAMPRR